MDEDEEKIAVAATFGISAVFKSQKSPAKTAGKLNFSSAKKEQNHAASQQAPSSPSKGPSQQNVDRERLTVDISALKQQYSKLRQRQKQAQIILSCKSTMHLFYLVTERQINKTEVSWKQTHLLLSILFLCRLHFHN